jgi:hypothetical protein
MLVAAVPALGAILGAGHLWPDSTYGCGQVGVQGTNRITLNAVLSSGPRHQRVERRDLETTYCHTFVARSYDRICETAAARAPSGDRSESVRHALPSSSTGSRDEILLNEVERIKF